MKILMTMVAALAITSAVSAQQSECTFTSPQDSFTRNYDGFVRVVYIEGGASVNIVDRRSGEVLDNVDFNGDRFIAQCGLNGSVPIRRAFNIPEINTIPEGEVRRTRTRTLRRSSGTINVTSTGGDPVITRTATEPEVIETTTTNNTRRGFAPTATFGLPN